MGGAGLAIKMVGRGERLAMQRDRASRSGVSRTAVGSFMIRTRGSSTRARQSDQLPVHGVFFKGGACVELGIIAHRQPVNATFQPQCRGKVFGPLNLFCISESRKIFEQASAQDRRLLFEDDHCMTAPLRHTFRCVQPIKNDGAGRGLTLTCYAFDQRIYHPRIRSFNQRKSPRRDVKVHVFKRDAGTVQARESQIGDRNFTLDW